MIQGALSSLKRAVFGPEVTMIADAKDVSDECFSLIFHRLDKKSLLNCMLSCRRFEDLISNHSFWVEQARQQNRQNAIPSLAWRRAAAQKKFPGNEDGNIYVEDFKFNLKGMILSGRGYDPIHPELEFVSLFETAPDRVLRGVRRSDDFSLRAPADGIEMQISSAVGCEGHLDVSRCFVFSYESSSIYTFIDLIASGIDAWVLDHVRPTIRITEKVNHRNDCSARLAVAAQLNYNETQWVQQNGQEQLTQSVDKPRYKSILKEWAQWTPANWEDVTFEFKDYPSGMRHLTLLNEGSDGQFWQGFYGPKVANIEIQVILPDEPILRPLEADTERRDEDENPEEFERRVNPRFPLFRRNRGMWGIPPAVLHMPNEEQGQNE